MWLTEMDLQLTNIEHFSECDIQAKIKQLRVSLSPLFQTVAFNKEVCMCVYLLALVPQSFQQEISLTTAKIEQIFHQGEILIEKSEPLDAAVIEEELEELQRYCQEVFGRVERYYKKLIRLPVRSENKQSLNLLLLYRFQTSNLFVHSL